MSRDIAAYLPFATNSNDTEFRYWLNKSGPWGWTNAIVEGGSRFVFQHLVFSSLPGAFVAEQFTGHFDIRGNKIFEADFLIFPKGSESIGYPEDLLYLVSQTYAGWRVRYIMPGTSHMIEVSLDGLKSWQVVGNIHEGITVKK